MTLPSVIEVVAGSPAAAAGIAIGDELLDVNGVRPTDVIEYQLLVDEAEVELTMRRSGVERSVDIEKRTGEPLGIRLSSSIFDRVQTCDNHCSFCFIYQLPPGMRRSLYLKDDDYRLSFLYGNFTTLTRFTELDLHRIVTEALGPLYVSIHATDPAVRAGMLRNQRGATSLRWLRALLDADVTVHGQIVLCPDINNGDVLERTCAEIIARYPELATVGVVPLGLSKYNTEALRVHTPREAAADIDVIEWWQGVALERVGRRLFFASDELYLAADRPFPALEAYEDFAQHENGIGMARAFYAEIDAIAGGIDAAEHLPTGEWRSLPAAVGEGYRAPRGGGSAGAVSNEGPVTVVSGEYGARVVEAQLDRLEGLAGSELRVLAVPNEFFGGNVAVAGLMVGEDIKAALAADDVATRRYLIPDVALSGDRFLDDTTVADVAAAAGAEVMVVEANAAGIIAGAGR